MNHTTELQTALMRTHPRLWKELIKVEFIEEQSPQTGEASNTYRVMFKDGSFIAYSYAAFARDRGKICTAIKERIEKVEKEALSYGTTTTK